MKKYALLGLFALFLISCSEMSTVQIFDNVKDGTVLIEDDLGDNKGGIGTGFILGNNMIVTNDHVINEPGKLYVYTNNSQKKYEAEVLYTDKVADIAVLKLKDWELFEKEQSPKTLVLGNSEKIKIGDKVVVVGHPWGLTWTVSEGILSGKNRRIDSNPKFLDQLDAHLFQGNSGGPIFNKYGQVVCISNMMLSKEGGSYGFCIPSNLVKKVLNDFETFKEVRWRMLNINVGSNEDGSAIVIKNIDPNGAAAKAGLKEGDILLEIFTPTNHPAGVKISSANDLITEMALLNGQDELVSLVIERDGKKQTIEVVSNFKTSKEFN